MILALALVMDAWLAALIVTVVLFVGAAVLALMGKSKVAGSHSGGAPSGRSTGSRKTSPP